MAKHSNKPNNAENVLGLRFTSDRLHASGSIHAILECLSQAPINPKTGQPSIKKEFGPVSISPEKLGPYIQLSALASAIQNNERLPPINKNILSLFTEGTENDRSVLAQILVKMYPDQKPTPSTGEPSPSA